MTEQDFLQSIYHDADDDVPRLIFSDWLEEHGNPDRAQFIRLQLACANDETGDASRPELMEQERELFERHKEEWLRELPELPGVEWAPHLIRATSTSTISREASRSEPGSAISRRFPAKPAAFGPTRRHEVCVFCFQIGAGSPIC